MRRRPDRLVHQRAAAVDDAGGDLGATEPGDASSRWGIEFANYYSPKSWLVFDGDFSWSRARFSSGEVDGMHVPEAVGIVVSGGASVDNYKRMFGSVRLRYFGPRALVEDNSVQSRATTLLNLEAGYQVTRLARINFDVFNLLNRSTVLGRQYNLRLSTADQVQEIMNPRVLRVGLRFGF